MGIIETIKGPTSVTILPMDRKFIGVIDRIVLTNTEIPSPQRFRLDVTSSQSRVRSTRYTHQPVDGNSLVADHAIKEPEYLQVIGKISDTPLGLFGFLGIAGALRGRARSEYGKLEELYDHNELLLVATSSHVYENMVITDLEEGRDLTTGGAIALTISFREMHIVFPFEVPSLEDLDAQMLAGDGVVDTGTQGLRPYDGTLGVPGIPG